MKKFISFLIILLCSTAFGQHITTSFVPVFIDSKTEDKIGEFPIDRKYYADAIKILSEYKARAVVLKFFFDLPKNTESDNKLSVALKLLPSFLQASLTPEQNPNTFESKYEYINPEIKKENLLNGNSGWIPLKIFSDSAQDIGFVDIRNANKPDLVPILESYQSKIVKNLIFSVLTYVHPEIKIINGKEIQLWEKTLKLNSQNEISITFPQNDYLQPISFIDLIEKKVDPNLIKDKIVILGYDGIHQPILDTSIGKLKAHRHFYYGLEYLFNKLE